MGVAELAIVMALSIPLAAVLGVTIVLIIKVLKGGRSGRGLDDDEARVMQEIHQGLERMERRVEALETLLLDRERKDES